MDRIEEAKSHLGAAISQSLPSDDQMIMQHVRDAHELLRQEVRDRRAVQEASADVQAAIRIQKDFNGLMGKVFGI